MSSEYDPAANRRRFLQYLAASPLLAAGSASALAETLLPKTMVPDPLMWGPRQSDHLIKSPKEAINVFDLEPVCRQNVPPAHFGYMASGIDDEVTLRANREGFLKFQFRPRRLVDVSKVDMSVDILGTQILLADRLRAGRRPEVVPRRRRSPATARAAKAGDHLQILSTSHQTPVEEVTKARGAPIWYAALRHQQVGGRRGHRHARREGRLPGAGGHRRSQRRPQPGNAGPAAPERHARLQRLPRPLELAGQSQDARDVEGHRHHRVCAHTQSSDMTWDFFKRMRDHTKMKILAKGILAWEDAVLAADAGLDGIIVSNHGARSEDSGRSTIDALPEIVEAVKGRIPILVDSGFRRGSDVVKALCMGATAVCVGRPYIWGLGAFGQAGVERALELLRIETHAMMQQVGAPSVKQLVPAMVRRA